MNRHLEQSLDVVPDAENLGGDKLDEVFETETIASAVGDLAMAAQATVETIPEPASEQPRRQRTIVGPSIDDDLALLAASGDPSALNEVFRIVSPLVTRYCRARFSHNQAGKTSADDIAQEVCIAALEALQRYRSNGIPFLAFVYGIASHKVSDGYRGIGRDRWELSGEVPDTPSTEEPPEKTYDRLELQSDLQQLLETLPDKQREILTLRIIVGLSAEDTATAVGSTQGAVRVAQHRALVRLRKEAEDRGLRVYRQLP